MYAPLEIDKDCIIHSKLSMSHTGGDLLSHKNWIDEVCVQTITQLDNAGRYLVELHRLLTAIALYDIHTHRRSTNPLQATALSQVKLCRLQYVEDLGDKSIG